MQRFDGFDIGLRGLLLRRLSATRKRSASAAQEQRDYGETNETYATGAQSVRFKSFAIRSGARPLACIVARAALSSTRSHSWAAFSRAFFCLEGSVNEAAQVQASCGSLSAALSTNCPAAASRVAPAGRLTSQAAADL